MNFIQCTHYNEFLARAAQSQYQYFKLYKLRKLPTSDIVSFSQRLSVLRSRLSVWQEEEQNSKKAAPKAAKSKSKSKPTAVVPPPVPPSVPSPASAAAESADGEPTAAENSKAAKKREKKNRRKAAAALPAEASSLPADAATTRGREAGAPANERSPADVGGSGQHCSAEDQTQQQRLGGGAQQHAEPPPPAPPPALPLQQQQRQKSQQQQQTAEPADRSPRRSSAATMRVETWMICHLTKVSADLPDPASALPGPPSSPGPPTLFSHAQVASSQK